MSAHPTIPYKRCLNNWRSAIVFNHINFKLVKRNCIEIIEMTHCFHLLAQLLPLRRFELPRWIPLHTALLSPTHSSRLPLIPLLWFKIFDLTQLMLLFDLVLLHLLIFFEIILHSIKTINNILLAFW